MFTPFTSDTPQKQWTLTDTSSDRCSFYVSQEDWRHFSSSALLPSSLSSPCSLFFPAFSLHGCFPLATLPAFQPAEVYFQIRLRRDYSLGALRDNIANHIHLPPGTPQWNGLGRKLIILVFLCGSKWWLEGLWISYQVFSSAENHGEMHIMSSRLSWARLIPACNNRGSLPDAKRPSSVELMNIRDNALKLSLSRNTAMFTLAPSHVLEFLPCIISPAPQV